MCEMIEIAGVEIPTLDWEATPASVKVLVNVLNERLSHIEEQLNQNSRNSSRPPSTDELGKGKQKHKPDQASAEDKPPKNKKRRRSSSSRQNIKLYAVEACSEVVPHVPSLCRHCGEELSGKDENPHRHQVVDIPPLEAHVVEHQLHELECDCCGGRTRAPLPADVPSNGYGDRLVGLVGLLSSAEHRQSHSMVSSLLWVLFAIELSRSGINRIRKQVNESLAEPVADAHRYVQQQASLHSDETSFAQRNRDGQNPEERKGWLWVLVTPLVSVFCVALSRSQATAQAIIGTAFSGIVHSDRYSSYNWLELSQRQVCWAHLKRDLTAIAQRSGVSGEIGEALLRRKRRLFYWWHRVRDGTMSRAQFIQAAEKLREGFKAELEEAANLPIGKKEKSPLAKTVRTLRKILQVEEALWTFVYIPGIEPTNNRAERGLRPAVIWRRTSLGSQSTAGSQFVGRILTVTSSLKAQERNALEYLTEACRAKRLGLPAPSLLPEVQEQAAMPVLLLLPKAQGSSEMTMAA
jgi:transposase